MSPLSYLLFTRFKNQIKGVFRSPAKLIYAVILIALLVLVIVGGGKGAAEMEEFRPASELYAIVLGFYALMLILIVNSGFSTGMSVFKMPDVNFLFAGPFRRCGCCFSACSSSWARPSSRGSSSSSSTAGCTAATA